MSSGDRGGSEGEDTREELTSIERGDIAPEKERDEKRGKER
jgi:hypothetical protein